MICCCIDQNDGHVTVVAGPHGLGSCNDEAVSQAFEGLTAIVGHCNNNNSSESSQHSDFSATTSDVSEWSGGGNGPGPRKPRGRSSIVHKGFSNRKQQKQNIGLSHTTNDNNSPSSNNNKLKHHRKYRHFNRTGFPKRKPKARVSFSCFLLFFMISLLS